VSNCGSCKCLEKIQAIQDVLWEQLKSKSSLMERIEREGDRLKAQCDKLQELYCQAEHEMQQMRAAIIEEYLRKRIQEVEPNDKKGANDNGLCSEGRPKATNSRGRL
jgi:hypothetical protein